MNITNTVLSKRKLQKLVSEGYVNGWDDPRLYTLEGLKRRGYTAKAINTFCDGITSNMTTIKSHLLESCLRDDLNIVAYRAKVVINPLKVTITNFPEDKIDDIKVLDSFIPFTRTIYIDRSDFREHDDPNFYRLAPNKTVGLSRAYQITCNEVIKDEFGNITELKVTYDATNSSKPQSHIQWVAECPERGSPVKIDIRWYEPLFLSENPDSIGIINPQSLTIITNCYADLTVVGSKHLDKFQFERIGYFCVDYDSTDDHLIFNRTVSLKEDSKKTL